MGGDFDTFEGAWGMITAHLPSNLLSGEASLGTKVQAAV